MAAILFACQPIPEDLGQWSPDLAVAVADVSYDWLALTESLYGNDQELATGQDGSLHWVLSGALDTLDASTWCVFPDLDTTLSGTGDAELDLSFELGDARVSSLRWGAGSLDLEVNGIVNSVSIEALQITQFQTLLWSPDGSSSEVWELQGKRMGLDNDAGSQNGFTVKVDADTASSWSLSVTMEGLQYDWVYGHFGSSTHTLSSEIGGAGQASEWVSEWVGESGWHIGFEVGHGFAFPVTVSTETMGPFTVGPGSDLEVEDVLSDENEWTGGPIQQEVFIGNGQEDISAADTLRFYEELTATCEVELPIAVGLDTLVIVEDTVAFSLDTMAVAELDSVLLRLVMRNGFPLESQAGFYLLDENGEALPGLGMTGVSWTAMPENGQGGQFAEPALTVVENMIDGEDLNRLVEAEHLVFEVRGLASGVEEEVQLTLNQSLRIQVGMVLHAKRPVGL